MPRRLNVFGQPLSYDVGVTYVDGVPRDRDRPIDPDGDDVSQATKDTVLKYAQDLTHGVEGGPSNANAFPLGGQASVVSLNAPDGSVVPLSVVSNADGQYVEPFTRAGRALEEATDSSLSETAPGEPMLQYPGDASFLRKGRSAGGEVDGHRLLSDGQNGDPHPEVATRYVSPILRNNRFSSDAMLAPVGGDDRFSAAGLDKVVSPSHPASGFGSRKRFVAAGASVPDGVLAEVGPMLTLRATGQPGASSSTGYGKDGPDGVGASASTLLPGGAQAGISEVSAVDLEASSALEALLKGHADPVNVSAGASGPRTVIDLDSSFGQINNVLEQFSGLLPLGMVATATALSVALNVALRAALATLLLVTTASNSNSSKRDDVGRFVPGDSRYNPAFQNVTFPPVPLPAKLFGLQETFNPYGDAVTEGIGVFFGGNVGGTLSLVIQSPGFYVVFCRSIVRSAADLALILQNVGRGNPIQVAENIVGFVEAIKASKVVSVLNMFAQIGDVSLSQKDRLKRFTPDDASRSGDSEIDNLEGLDAMRSRKRGSLATAWGASTTQTSLVLPNSVSKAMLSSRAGALGGLTAERTNIDYTPTSRIATKDLEVIERELDAEYLPFYFHDLRTNEVVSFQAFLASLNEDYTANYDSVDGYGRVDSVKLYRSTSRKIGVQFVVAATSQEDFDAMWVKINKLTTLVYPQWSRGTLLNAGTSRFVQPFSQVPTASPLVRVRVGDLWTSNYSRFSLARVFGLGSDDTFKLQSFVHRSDSDVTSFETAVAAALTKIEDAGRELPRDSVWLLEPGDYEAAAQDQGALGAAASALAGVASVVGVKTPTNARVVARLRTYTRVAISQAANRSKDAYAVKILDNDGLPDAVRNADILVSRSHLSIGSETLATLGVRESSPQDDPLDQNNNSDKIVSLADFFSPDNNAVVKGFEASKGRGVACVIESMSFDWNNVPWETGIAGARAPKMCKITLGMSVVHDIAPGIDADGFNRAPVYSVGRQSNAMAGKDPASPDGSGFKAAMDKVRRTLI